MRRLWVETYPHQPDVDPAPALARGRVLVGAGTGDRQEGPDVHGDAQGDPVRAAAFISPVGGRPDERRLQVVAATGEDWRAMHTAVVDRLRRHQVQRWHVTIREDSTAVLQRLVDAGYQVTSWSWGAVLHLREDDVPALEQLADEGGVHLRRLVDSDVVAAHALFRRCRVDFPTTPATTPPDHSLDEMADMVSGTGAAFGAFAPTGHAALMALTVMRVAGTGAGRGEDAGTADTEFTVTERSARRRGLASAVKAYGVLQLARQGVRTFRTGGAEVNEASLRANQRLGYVVEPLWLTLSAS